MKQVDRERLQEELEANDNGTGVFTGKQIIEIATGLGIGLLIRQAGKPIPRPVAISIICLRVKTPVPLSLASSSSCNLSLSTSFIKYSSLNLFYTTIMNPFEPRVNLFFRRFMLLTL
jgi:hypothetical protein